MMKQTVQWCHTPSMAVQVQLNSTRSLQLRRGLRLKRPNGGDAQGPPGKSQPSQRNDKYFVKVDLSSTIIIQRQEMASYFKLFDVFADDDLIQDFLWMDCCCKLTDKYLLAMAFVYFKRACFSPSEYTRKNFFMALYLANTMEEDEEENKYEIFPWALGKNWRKHFPRFLKQRDHLWARIDYRAAVSRRCCEEVMAIVPSHFVWQRERSEHHSGAHRQYGLKDQTPIPRGPAASPVSCILCSRSAKLGQSLISPHGCTSAQAPNSTMLPMASSLSLEMTPPRITSSHRKLENTQFSEQHSSCCFADKVYQDELSCRSTCDTSLDWISEE